MSTESIDTTDPGHHGEREPSPGGATRERRARRITRRLGIDGVRAMRPVAAPRRGTLSFSNVVSHGDLAVLAALLALTALFGRPFAKLGVPGAPIYVTEVALAAVLALGVARCGVSGAIARVRRVVPLAALLILWIAGAIAAARGVYEFGFSRVLHDIGLVEYSLVLVLVAVVVDTRARAHLLYKVLLYAGLGATFVFALIYFVIPDSAIGLTVNPGAAIALYLSLWVLLALARVAHGLPHRRRDLVAVAVGLIFISLTVQRSALLALFAALVTLVVLAPRKRRPTTAAIAVASLFVSVVGALLIQSTGVGGGSFFHAQTLPTGALQGSRFVADDGASTFVGGHGITGDAAQGRESREIAAGETFELAALTGLDRGQTYTVEFAIKPLEARVTSGWVGDTSGSGWGTAMWTTVPVVEWQRFRERLTATATTERLVIFPATGGAEHVRVDAIQVREGAVGGPERDVVRPDLADRAPGEVERAGPRRREPALVGAARGTFTGSSPAGGYSTNQRWRLAYWRFVLARTGDAPVFGVGFGRPAEFEWNGVVYDARRGNPTDPNDVTNPHNSFLNLLFRAGLLGFVPLVALLAIAVWRAWRSILRTPTSEDRGRLVGIACVFVFAFTVANFNVALEGPYMSLFFWTTLGLLFVIPALSREQDPKAAIPEGGPGNP